MPDLRTQLQTALTGKVAVLCVGSPSRGDDIFGPLVAKRIFGRVSAEVTDAENVPENYLGKVAKTDPDTVLIVDAALFGGQPGQLKLLDPSELEESSFSTHSASLKLVEDFFQAECNAKVFLLAAQPVHVRFDEKPSPEITRAADLAAQLLTELLPPPSA